MNTQVFVAIISAAATIVVAALTFFLNERAKRKAEWQQKKFGHYKALLSALSGLVGSNPNRREADKNFSEACNTVALVASQEVVTSLMEFQDEISISNKSKSRTEHDRLLKKLLLAMRKDVGLSSKDNPVSFIFHLSGKPE